VSEQNPYQGEIGHILLTRSNTRAAKVLSGMNRNLTNAEMSLEAGAAGEPCNEDSIAAVRRIVRLTLADERVPAPSDAQEQAGIYRELLNYPHSENLHQHIITRLTQLQQIDPKVKLTPLEHGHLGSNNVPRPERQVPPCRECNLVHAGECM
jgi:hypothetical protein